VEIQEALKNISKKDRERLDEFNREISDWKRKHENISSNNKYTAPWTSPKSK
jgi:hypothetical protein